MISRRLKSSYFTLARPLMALSGHVYRATRAPRSGTVYVHLGPGRDHYTPGWINVDANIFSATCDVWADLRNRLPFRDNSLTAVYSHHVLEHLPDASRHLRDIRRCLKPGGVLRLGVPDIESAIAKFLERDLDWFGEWPDKRRSAGGRLESFIFCRGEHSTAFTSCYLSELLEDAGFVDVTHHSPVRSSGYPEIFEAVMAKEWESDYDAPHTLLVECRKPSS